MLKLLFNMIFGKKADSVSMQEFVNNVEKNKNNVVLDVRNPDEVNGPLAKIKRAVHIPLPQLESRLNELDKYKSKNIYVLCHSGGRSAMAASVLINKGYNAINVNGGMAAYKSLKG